MQLNTAQQKQQRRMQKLLARNRRGLAVGEAGLLANRAAGRRMSSMGGIRARQVNALEAEHGGLLQSTWGPKTRREARKILSAESAARPSKQAGGGQHQNVLAWLASIGVLSPTPNSKIKRQNKINAALQRRDGAVAMRALGQSPAPSIKTGDDIRALIRRGALRRDAGADALRAAKHNARGLRAKKVGDDARARRMAAGKPADIMDLSQNARVQEVNALEAEHARGTTWGSETRRMAREKVSDQSNADRMAQIGRARMQTSGARRRSAARARNFAARGAPVAGGRGAPVAGRRRGSDPDSQFGNDRPGSSRVGRASAVTSPVRGPEPRADGRRHAEESLRLPAGHEFQDIDEFPPKGFPAHLDEVTPKGGGERLPIDLNGVTFKQWRHEDRSDYDPEHMKNFQDMTPGVRKTAAGKLFVQKIALPGKTGPEAVDSSRKSTNQEMIADRIFRILGVPAPRSQVYSLKTGLPVPHDYQWAPGEASTRLAEHLGKDATTMGGAPQAHRDAWEGHERRYAVAKALLDHGDNHGGNTMLDGKHIDVPWKVDNGSALKYDAFGGEKSAGSWGEVSPQGILFPQLYKMIGLGTVTPREAYRQMEGIAKIWRRHGGSIKELYKNDDDPKQAKIFSSRAESIVRAVDMFKGPNEFARAMITHFRAYDQGDRTTANDLLPKRKRKGSGLSTGGGSLAGSEFMARSFRWGMNV